ncbi:MAG: FtsX-like permease family protein [Verrucomicrobiota bacterium]|jgi:putative ABC transport system permease protein
MKFLPLLWSNLKRRKLRTLLTLLSILVAFMLFGFIAAIKQALVGGLAMAGADRLIVRHKVSLIISLPGSYQQTINKIPGVAGSAHETWFGGIYQDPRNFFPQTAVVPEEILAAYPEIVLSPQEKQAWLNTRTGAVAGRKTAQRFGWKIGDKIPITTAIWTKADGSQLWEFDLVGIFDGREKAVDTTALMFRYDYFDEGRRYDKGHVGWYIIRVRDPSQAVAISKRIDDEFANSPAETKTEPEGAFAQSFAKQIGNIGLIAQGILGAVFFTILLVAGNTVAQSVRERTGELGVLKAIGFTNVQVLGQVLAEACALSVLGGVLGLGLSWLVISRGDPTGGLLPMYYFPAKDLLTGLGISLALGVAAGILPALQAMRLRVAEALRRM